MQTFLQLVLNGLMLGGLFAIISVGLTLIFGIIRLVNFAHGELLMVGMYLTWLGTAKLGLHPYVLAPPLVLVLFVLGVLIQRFILQPLLEARDAHVQIFATVGLSTALINLALLVFGADLYATPASGVRDSVTFGPFRLLVGQLVMFLCGLAVVGALHLFMERTYLGRAIRAETADVVTVMMESTVSDGTGFKAFHDNAARPYLPNIPVASKTGTAWTADGGSYSTSRRKASFGGVVPASHPRLAAIVVIDEPSGAKYYGGEIAAPVFANVMAGALRLLGVPPDGLDRLPATTLVQANP